MKGDMLNTYFKKSDSVVFRKIADEFILVPVRKDAVDLKAIFSFNETGARIWELIDEKKTVSDIAKVICKEFNQEKDKVQKDAVEFITQLKDLKFVIKMK